MNYVLSVIPSGHRRRLLALFILMAALGAAVLAGTRLDGALPAAEAAPPSSPSAQVSLSSAYIQFTVNGGQVDGDVTRKGWEGWSELYSFSQSMNTSIESGLSRETGRVRANPITVTKPVDKSTPLLCQAMLTNQVVDAEIRMRGPSGVGPEEEIFSYHLEGGRIAGQRINAIPGDPGPET